MSRRLGTGRFRNNSDAIGDGPGVDQVMAVGASGVSVWMLCETHPRLLYIWSVSGQQNFLSIDQKESLSLVVFMNVSTL